MEDVPTTLFQIWIMPDRAAARRPSWGARPFPKGDRAGRFVTLASGFANDEDALPIRTDARVVGATLKAGETRGLSARQGLAAPIWCRRRARSRSMACASTRATASPISDVDTLRVTAIEDSEIVLVDAA